MFSGETLGLGRGMSTAPAVETQADSPTDKHQIEVRKMITDVFEKSMPFISFAMRRETSTETPFEASPPTSLGEVIFTSPIEATAA